MSTVTKPVNFDTDDFVQRAKRIYQERYQAEFEKLYKDKFVAIEVDSGDHFIGDSKMEAYQKAIVKYPGKFFHFILIGHKGVYKRR
ncbi:MAG: hypothetical protein ALAOOOJD_01869 [bacterium]|nr:hypothetical protein [bacterium]